MNRFLIVDESPVIRKVAARILVGAGVECTVAGSAAEAEALFAAEPPFDCAIVSAALGDAGPEALLRALRARPGQAGIPVFVSLSETSLGLMTRCRRAGATGFVFRPFDRASLLGWLSPHLPAKAAA